MRTNRFAQIAVVGLLLVGSGCNSEDPAGPSNAQQPAPVLPAPARLTFDFDLFTQKPKATASTQLNFLNAQIRVAVIDVITRAILTPPVTALSLALHTIPSLQPDGSYLWVYTYVEGDEEAQIRLRGKEEGNSVVWALRVTALNENPPIDDELWFDGVTESDGASGRLDFHDFKLPGKPVVARVTWGTGDDGEFLTFTDLNENVGDSLSYFLDGKRASIVYRDASESAEWFIKWDGATGAGSLRVPDYKEGHEACWNERQNDVVCPPAT